MDFQANSISTMKPWEWDVKGKYIPLTISNSDVQHKSPSSVQLAQHVNLGGNRVSQIFRKESLAERKVMVEHPTGNCPMLSHCSTAPSEKAMVA
jgi:hypothetical protein